MMSAKCQPACFNLSVLKQCILNELECLWLHPVCSLPFPANFHWLPWLLGNIVVSSNEPFLYWIQTILGELGHTMADDALAPSVPRSSGDMALTMQHKWRLCLQKPVSQAGIINYIPQFTVGCNYLSLREIPASGDKVLKWAFYEEQFQLNCLNKIIYQIKYWDAVGSWNASMW